MEKEIRDGFLRIGLQCGIVMGHIGICDLSIIFSSTNGIAYLSSTTVWYGRCLSVCEIRIFFSFYLFFLVSQDRKPEGMASWSFFWSLERPCHTGQYVRTRELDR